MIRTTLGFRPTLAVVFSFALVACGGGGTGSQNPANPGTGGTPPPTSSNGTQQGRFVDAAVAGVDYRTATRQGLTGAQGQFDYEPGESVQFFVGGLALGRAVPAAAVVTPVELTGAARGQPLSVAATNMAWLLQSLDSDCDDANGLQISDAARQAGLGRALDFNQAAATFTIANGPAAQLIAQGGPSCRQSQALSHDAAGTHLQASLDALAAAAATCTADQWCVGAAKKEISPSHAQVAGQPEERAGGIEVNQFFHLGGFGFGPFETSKLVEALIPQFDQRMCAGDSCVSNPPAHRPYHCVNAFTPGFPGDCAGPQKEHTYVRAMYVAQGGQQVLFLIMDAVGAGNIIMDGIKSKASLATGVPFDSVIIGATHSHAGADLQGLWGGVPEEWVRDLLYTQAAAAAVAAKNNARAATLTYGTGQELAFNNYRRPRVDPTHTTDKTLGILQARDSNGAVLGTLVQYAAHPTSIGEDSGGDLGRAPHADYPLGITDTVESATGAPAIYYNGPIADASGGGPTFGSDDYRRVHSRGECVAKSALTLLNPESPQQCSYAQLSQMRRVELAPQLQVQHREAMLPVTNPLFSVLGVSGSLSRYYDFTPVPLSSIPEIGEALAAQQANLPQLAPSAQTTVSRVTLGGAAGGLEIVTIPGETTNSFGRYIRSLAATPNMMLFGLTHNSFGYILPEEEFNYIDSSGDAGFVLPFTGYEEFVSIGPLTAPALRLQAYNPLFGIPAGDPRNAPPSATACTVDAQSRACLLQRLIANVDYIQRNYYQQCNDNLVANAPAAQKDRARQFCALINPETPLYTMCVDAGLGAATCEMFGNGGTVPPGQDPIVLAAAADALTRGCDAIDPTNCLYPFPSDHFTKPEPLAPTFRTGKRVNFLPMAMPRNTAGKPIDPTEWNRNDGFSPGTMVMAVVPGLDSLEALKATYGFPSIAPDNVVGITNFGLSLQPNAPIEVLEVGAANTATPHPVWAEIDVNAGQFLNLTGGDPVGLTDPLADAMGEEGEVQRPGPYYTSLILRPAKNFTPGKRYVVVLRNLKDADGAAIPAGPVFAACKARFNNPASSSGLMPIDNRCDELRTTVLPVLQNAGVAIDNSLFLAWDFTVASTENTTARLVHMRDEAFKTLKNAPTADCSKHSEPAALPASADLLPCQAPEFTVDAKNDAGEFWQIEGTVKTPSFLNQGDASPQDDGELTGFVNALRSAVQSAGSLMASAATQCAAAGPLAGGCASFFNAARDAFNTFQGDVLPIALGANAVPNNRLHYRPNDDGGLHGFPGTDELYGDGLPDLRAIGTNVTSRFTCRIPKVAFDPAAPAHRPSLYGHGLLGSRGEVGSGSQNAFAREHQMMMCAVDWYGFAEGDIANVASTLVDLSQFPVVPDASQQGFVNWMFLARALQHPAGFASRAEFQKNDGTPVFDRREVFYDGNSQGGILPGPIVAVSKDLNRGVFGVPGMNYSTLLRRSIDFTPYSIPLYVSYQNELDRNVNFALIQMLWDRAENDGYARYLTPNGKLDGQNNAVLLHPAYGDHQVTMWSVDVMARTMGDTAIDHSRIEAAGRTHPDVVPFLGIPEINYVDDRATGSAEVVFVEPGVVDPPIDETPPDVGRDPHGFPRGQQDGRCQKSNFLRSDGFVARTNGLDATSCIAKFGAVPTVAKPGYRATPPPTNGGLLGLLGDVMANLNDILQAVARGDFAGAGDGASELLSDLVADLSALIAGPDGSVTLTVAHAVDNIGDPGDLIGDLGRDLGLVLGLSDDPAGAVQQAIGVNRKVEPVVLTGAAVPSWSARPAQGVAYPYPSGAVTTGQLYEQFGIIPGQVRNAHNGQLLYPAPGAPVVGGTPVGEIAAFAWRNGWVEIPVQVDEMAPYFLANANSDFSIYSGTDPELSYVWDNGDPHAIGVESWGMTGGTCTRAYDTNGLNDGPNNGISAAIPDPVPGLDDDDEIVFMASDAGDLAPLLAKPAGASDGQQIVLSDPLGFAPPRYVYLFRKAGGSSFNAFNGYVKYVRDANASQWIDRSFFADNDPQKIGTSNTGYGPNLTGTVCPDGTPATAKGSNDRFPRDGVTVSTSAYQWRATGRWMVRDLKIAKPNQPGVYGNDVVDRWKGRAFQQSPDSFISLVGFEDEQVNWEANSALLGERAGPVRAIREIWGADSGTNVTKTETFYRDAITYRYHLRVHPIPPDGLYTSWDYNRGAMLPTQAEQGAGVQAGRYFSALRPQGVPIDGVNDELGNIDSLMGSPAFFDVPDPTFNVPATLDNWEQVSAKGDQGSMVYTFEIKGLTSFTNALVVPYYRDDACLDDGTGDDPVQRFWPGEAYDWNGGAVRQAYDANAGRPLDYDNRADCVLRQGAYGSHGVHFFFTHDTDNAASPLTTTEVDGMQWQFLVPTATPQNIAEPYANTVRVPLRAAATPRL